MRVSKAKQSRHVSNRKRYNRPVASERLWRRRKPETLQSFRQKQLQPWLELANIMDASRDAINDSLESMDPEKQAEALRPLLSYVGQAENTEWFPAEQMRQWLGRPRDESVSEELAPMERSEPLYNLALNVARTFHFYLDETPWNFADENGPREIARLSKTKDGRVDVEVFDPYIEYFVPAIQGVEIARIRRCPVCGRFFYAVRGNTMACREHLARARVQSARERKRNPELRRQYEETRRINRLVRKGMSLKEARAEVQKKRRKRRTVQ